MQSVTPTSQYLKALNEGSHQPDDVQKEAVSRLERVVGIDGLVPVSDSGWDPASAQIDHVNDFQGGDHTVYQGDVHLVAHCDRVGTFDAFESEITFNLAVNQLPVVSFYLIPASCIFYN